MVRQEIALHLFGQFKRRNHTDSVPKTLNHGVGVGGDEAEFVVGGYRHEA